MIPQAFHQQMCALLGDTEAGALCTALASGATPTSIRTNPFKPLSHEAQLWGDIPQRPVPWCEGGAYLAERPTFAHDPLWHAGAYYVQEAASMFIAQAYRTIVQHLDELGQDRTALTMLDLCAAPGGKSTLWRSLLPENALLVANEPMRQRAQILAENLTKWGQPNTFVTQAFPEAFSSLHIAFDIIATDVPCSGEGMFRKDEQAREEWSPSAVVACAERQKSILRSVWPALKEGGFCVYSTCTFNREENEDLVVWICRELGADILPIPTEAAWHISGDTTARELPVYHFFPHRSEGEGLFLALLRKTSASAAEVAPQKRAPKSKNRGKSAPAKPDAKLLAWLQRPEDFTFSRSEAGIWTACPTNYKDIRDQLAQVAPLLLGGIEVAEEKGRKFIPQHALSMSVAADEAAFPRVEISHALALAYLHREAITLPPEAPRGYVLLTYRGLPLGFANNLGSRANNLYPNEWRLRNL